MRLTYRPLAPHDLVALTAIVSDWQVVRQLGSWPWPPDPAFTRARCAPYRGVGFVWGVHTDRLIGTVGVTDGSLGYMFDRTTAGRGIATMAARHAVATAFAADRALAHVDATCWHDNPASARVLHKLGFVHWRTAYVRSPARGLPVLCHGYRLRRP